VPGNPAEPIGGIPVVRFAAMQQGMDQASIPISAILDQIVCWVMVVVIEEGGGCEKFSHRNRQIVLAGEL
jgi:hypothetical protein